MNAKEIIQEISAAIEGEWEDFFGLDLSDGTLSYIESKVGVFEEVQNYGGEGKGDAAYSVYYFKDHDTYLKLDGYYSSYNGFSFDEPPFEVFPKTKTITVFE